MKVNLVVVKTKQPELLKTQYEALGITFQYHNHGDGPFHFVATLSDVVFEIYPLPASLQKADNSTRLGFEVEAIDILLPNIIKAGWGIHKNPTQTQWGYAAVIVDNDGRKVELKES